MTPILAFAILALTFALGDFIALKTRGIVSTFVTAILIFVTFGGILGLLPADLIDISGLSSLIPTFGMALILTNLGSCLDFNQLFKEWKTIIISIAGIVGIGILCYTLGQVFFDREYVLSAIAPISGGIVAVMITSEVANEAFRPDIAQFTACIMAFQMVIGVPIASVTLKKAVSLFAKTTDLNSVKSTNTKGFNIKFIKNLPKSFDTATTHFARLSLVACFAQVISNFSGINATICYVVFGALASATGIVDSNALKKAGGDGILLLATYCYVIAGFLSLTFSEFTAILIPAMSLLLIGAVGVSIFSVIAGKLLKCNPFLSIAIGISCMFGYPITYAVATEVVTGVTTEQNLSNEQSKVLLDEFLPKMIVAGIVSVSIVSVIVAGIIAPIIF